MTQQKQALKFASVHTDHLMQSAIITYVINNDDSLLHKTGITLSSFCIIMRSPHTCAVGSTC